MVDILARNWGFRMDNGKLAVAVEEVYESLDAIVDSLQGDLKEKSLELLTQLDGLRDELLDQVEPEDPEDYPEDVIDVEKVDIYG